MAWNVVVHCSNCEARCQVIPAPFFVATELNGDVMAVCQRDKRLVKIKFGGDDNDNQMRDVRKVSV